ncbi:MAG: hypothetical protein JW810_07845 [Sedimentisphaerales bacterium]|nr:hypothetical protein [Sedimentisphaerales bacterium]
MGLTRICLMVLAVAAVVIGMTACRNGARQAAEEEPLLLLDDEGDSELFDQANGPAADNSRCYVCHINFDGEALTATHARGNVGCEDCHGASNAHCSDEDNITPPDRMFAKASINSFCRSCHPSAKLGAGKDYCVQCHGTHRLEHRTRTWDKQTGELIKDDKVRMTSGMR